MRNSNLLHDYLTRRSFSLESQDGAGEMGCTGIWDNRVSPPRVVPESVSLVEDYRQSLKTAAEVYAEALARMPSVNETAELSTARKKALEAITSLDRSLWKIGDRLIEYRELYVRIYPNIKCTKTEIANTFKLRLTAQRIGQLMDTSAYFAPELRDNSVQFRVYEEARKINEGRESGVTAEDLAQTVKANPSVTAIRKAMGVITFKQRETPPISFTIIVTEEKGEMVIRSQQSPNCHEGWRTEAIRFAIANATRPSARRGTSFPLCPG